MSEPMQTENFVDKIMNTVRGFGLRIVVHVSAFFCAGVVAGFVPSMAAMATYMGLICLVARETRMQIEWLVPLGFGLGQMVLGLVFGLPLYEALFWGGAQAWVQRMFMKRFAMGTEWATAVFLFPLALRLSATTSQVILILGSFAVVSFAGMAFWQLRMRLEHKKRSIAEAHEQMLAAAAAAKAEQEGRCAVASEASMARLDEYKTSIAKLRTKQLMLPQPLQPTLMALTKSADAIVLCMQQDMRDKEPGEKFLRRYLPATHSVLDNYRRLSGTARANTTVTEDVEGALTHSIEIMQRLEKAFAQEHKSLLRNDIDDFSADLNVLDTLLKMEGK